MRITTEQLRAIEKAIGREAKAWADTGEFGTLTTICVSAVHQGHTVKAAASLSSYMRQEALEPVVRNLVHRINDEILNMEFSQVRW